MVVKSVDEQPSAARQPKTASRRVYALSTCFLHLFSLVTLGLALILPARAESYFCDYMDADNAPVETAYRSSTNTVIHFKGAIVDRKSSTYTAIFQAYTSENHEATRIIIKNTDCKSFWVSCHSKAGGSQGWDNLVSGAGVPIEGTISPTGSCLNATWKSYSQVVGTESATTVKLHPSNAKVRLWYFRVVENGVTVCDWRPYVQEGTAGYYDVVGETFATSSTGTLTPGPRVGGVRYVDGQLQYQVEVVPTEGATATLSPAGDSGWYAPGTSVTVTSTKNAGFTKVFALWKGNLDDVSNEEIVKSNITFTVNRPRRLTAVFLEAMAGGISAKAYVQDGLVAHWDGIENVGYGLHDAAATTWMDLVNGSNSIALSDGDSSGDSYLDLTAATHTSTKAVFSSAFTADSKVTLEVYSRPLTSEAAANWDSLMVRVPNFASLAYDGRKGGISIYRVESASATSMRYLGYKSGYDTLAALVSAGKAQTYSAVIGVASSTVYVNAAATTTSGGLDWTGGSRSSLLSVQVGAAKTTQRTSSVRVYNRALTADEVAVNRVFDRMRFEGATSNETGYAFIGGKVCVGLACVARGDGVISVNGGAAVSALPTNWLAHGSSVTLTATPAEGRFFHSWQGDVAGLTAEQQFSPTMTLELNRARSLRAVFRAEGDDQHAVPGDFPSLADALASIDVLDGDTITLADGTHKNPPALDSTGLWLAGAVRKAVTITGSSPTNVFLDCGTAGGLLIANADALVANVTLQNFYRQTNSYALYMTAGTLSNVCFNGTSGKCMSSSSYAFYTGSGALITDCVFRDISKSHWGGSRLINIAGSTVRRTQFLRLSSLSADLNTNASNGRRARFEDCLFANNYDYYTLVVQSSDTDFLGCTFRGNSCSDQVPGMQLGNVTMDRCVISNNTSNGTCPLVYCVAGASVAMTNCLVALNTCNQWGALKIGGKSTRLELVNTTVANNRTSSGTYCGGITGDGASDGQAKVTLVNSIIWGNTANGVVKNFGDYLYTDFHFTNSCYEGVTPATESGCTTLDPLFVAAAKGDFSLGEGSPCVDSGCDLPAVSVDLAGKARPIDGTGGTNPKWDMGCHEADARDIPVQCTLNVLDSEGAYPCAVRQSATVIGSRLTGLEYEWVAVYCEGGVWRTNRCVTATNAYAFADLPLGDNYSFACIVRNDQGNASTSVVENCFSMLVDTCYVSNEGSDTFPYTNAATAARDLASAVAKASRRIVVLPGEYRFSHATDGTTGYDCMGAVTRAVSVECGARPEDVVLDCNGGGGIVLANAEASLCGVTFRNYRTSVNAPVLYIRNGSASNIVVSGSNIALKSTGCAVYVGEYATLDGLVVTNSRGGAASVVGGTLRNAYFADCTAGGSYVLSTYASTHSVRATLKDVVVTRSKTTNVQVAYLSYGDAYRLEISDCENANRNTSVVHLDYGNMTDSKIVRCMANSGLTITGTWINYGHTLRGCLVADNTFTTGAALNQGGSPGFLVIESTTVANNACGGAPAGGVNFRGGEYSAGFTMLNSIVWGNTTNGVPSCLSSRTNPNLKTTCTYSCFEDAGQFPNNHNLAAEPYVRRDGRLRYPSPCLDAGKAQAWHATGTDIFGHPRLMFKGVDLGCAEIQRRPALTVFVR